MPQLGGNTLDQIIQSQPQGPGGPRAPTFSMGGMPTNPLFYTSGPSMRPTQPGDVQDYSAMDPMLRDQLTGIQDAGHYEHGIQALLGADYRPWTDTVGGAEGELTRNWNLDPMKSLAQTLGYDLGNYDFNNTARLGGGAGKLWDDLSRDTNDYYKVTGASGSWNPNPDDRWSAATLYKRDQENQLNPLGPSSFFHSADPGGFYKQNADEINGILSTVMPAFGGWAGMLGSGASGTLSAGSGLGLTSGLTSAIGSTASNALVNAAIQSALTGSGAQGFLGSLGSAGMNAGLSSAMGNMGLGNIFGTTGSGQAVNPLQYYNATMGRAGGTAGLAGMFRK